MNFQKLTVKAQDAMQKSQEIASANSNQHIEPVHLLRALLDDAAGIIAPMLLKLGTNVDYLKNRTDDEIDEASARRHGALRSSSARSSFGSSAASAC